MAPESHPRNDDRVEPSTPQTFTPSNTRLANIADQAVEKRSGLLEELHFSEEDDDNEIQGILDIVWVITRDALKDDARLKGQLEMEECHEERRENYYRLPGSYVHKQRYTREQSLEGLIRRRYIVLFG